MSRRVFEMINAKDQKANKVIYVMSFDDTSGYLGIKGTIVKDKSEAVVFTEYTVWPVCDYLRYYCKHMATVEEIDV